MEYVTGKITLKKIFLDNGNWWKFFCQHREFLKISVILNVLKLLVCRTAFLGFHLFACICGYSLKVFHSCKSRFCPSCGKKATDIWIKNSYNSLPNTIWQHITFTMAAQLWEIFKLNKHLLKQVPALAANIILDYAEKKNYLPGIFSAIHTFGRDLKYNIHIHLSTTVGGLSLLNKSWVKTGYFYHKTLKNRWRYLILTLLRNEFKNKNLTLPKHLQHLKTYESFCSWTGLFYDQEWVVQLNKQSDNLKHNIEYLGKYLKRPPLGETRILKYDGQLVTFCYLDHYTKTTQIMTLPVLDFIARLIQHIPDKNFRMIRYYGFLANAVRSKLLPIVYRELNSFRNFKSKVYLSFRTMFKSNFNRDPLICPVCKSLMNLKQIILPTSNNLLFYHEDIAHGLFQSL